MVNRPAPSREHFRKNSMELVKGAPVTNSRSRNIILGPFGRSGTQVIAFERLSQQARVIELDRTYGDVIANRWEAFTGDPVRWEAGGNGYSCESPGLLVAHR